MKIGFDAKRLYKNFTGLGNYSRTLVHNLHSFFPEDEYYLYTPSIRQTPETEPFLDGNSYKKTIPQGGLKAYWRSYSIKKDLKKDRLSLYHGLSHEIPFGMKATGIKTVVTIHDIIYLTYPAMFTAIDRAIYDFKFRYSCKHADKIIAISESTKKDIIHYFGTPEEKIEVIYQALNPVFYDLPDKNSSKQLIQPYHLPEDYLLYVGAVNSRKNLLGIVKALAILPEEFRLPLVIVGNGGDYKKEVIGYATEHHIADRLIWMTNLTDTRTLQAFYQHARLFIYPSFYEGFGLPVTEALLSKVPVITAGVSSLPEAGGPHTLYVSPNDREELREAIIRTLADTELRKTMTEEGYDFAHRQFAPERLTGQVHNLYHQLL